MKCCSAINLYGLLCRERTKPKPTYISSFVHLCSLSYSLCNHSFMTVIKHSFLAHGFKEGDKEGDQPDKSKGKGLEMFGDRRKEKNWSFCRVCSLLIPLLLKIHNSSTGTRESISFAIPGKISGVPAPRSILNILVCMLTNHPSFQKWHESPRKE